MPINGTPQVLQLLNDKLSIVTFILNHLVFAFQTCRTKEICTVKIRENILA